MRKFIIALLASSLSLLAVAFYYYRNFGIERISTQSLPKVPEQASLILHIRDLKTFWRNFSKTNLHSAISKTDLLSITPMVEALLNTPNDQKHAGPPAVPLFISIHKMPETNEIEYLFYLPKDLVSPSSIRRIADADPKEAKYKLSSKKFKIGATEYLMYLVELDDFIIISKSRQLLREYLDSVAYYKKIFQLAPYATDSCSITINPISLKNLLQEGLLLDLDETNFGKLLDAISNQKNKITLSLRVTNDCVAMNGFLTAKSSDSLFFENSDMNEGDIQFYDFRKFLTANMRSLELVFAPRLGAFVERELKSYSDSMQSQKNGLYNLLYVLDKKFVHATLDRLGDSGEVLHLTFMRLKDGVSFLDELIADDDLSISEKKEIPEKVYRINHGGFQKVILKNICPLVLHSYMLLLQDYAVLSNDYKALAAWYDSYTRKTLWGVTTKYLAYDRTTLHFVLDAQRLIPDVRAYFKSEWQDFAKKFFKNVRLISLNISHKEDDIYTISLILSMGH